MLSAWRHLQDIRRAAASVAEQPIAYLHSSTVNMKRTGEPLPVGDFLLFANRSDADANLTPQTADAALELQRRGQSPELLTAMWPEVVKAARKGVRPPECLAWTSADGQVWVIDPQREPDGRVRAGLVLCRGTGGPVALRELDRPLLTHRVVIPQRRAAYWCEAGTLLELAT